MEQVYVNSCSCNKIIKILLIIFLKNSKELSYLYLGKVEGQKDMEQLIKHETQNMSEYEMICVVDKRSSYEGENRFY